MDGKKVPPRKNFDYQERWHGFGSPAGLGVGLSLLSPAMYSHQLNI